MIEQNTRTWVLGAPDPEMERIEAILKEDGETVAYAEINGERCHAGNAYRANFMRDASDGSVGDGFGDSEDGRYYLVECGFLLSSSYVGEDIVHIDHHRPGDPGYNRPPAEFLPASSIGQVWAILHDTPEWSTSREMWVDGSYIRPAGVRSPLDGGDEGIEPEWLVPIPSEIYLCAAADHCLAAAYAGECPGIYPWHLERWRISCRSKFQRRTIGQVRGDIRAAKRALEQAPKIKVNGALSDPDAPTTQREAILHALDAPTYEVADMRQHGRIPELPEAAAQLGMPFIALVTERDGREKLVLQAAPPPVVGAFLEGLFNAHLVDIYGDVYRGFAGGYIP